MARIVLGVAALAVLQVAMVSEAVGLSSNGQLRMYITDDGAGTIMNWTGDPARFDGYAVRSAAGLIDTAGWTPIAEQAATDPQIAAVLGQSAAEALLWAPTSVAPDLIGESHPDSAATLQPGDSFSLGAAFGGDWWTDLTFTYYDSATGGSWDNTIWPPPACEPTPLDLGGPYVWDVTAATTLVCEIPGHINAAEKWSILEHPHISLGSGRSIKLTWGHLKSAGIAPGRYTLHAGGFSDCGTWTESTTTLTIVPEPATLSLLGLAALALLVRRRS